MFSNPTARDLTAYSDLSSRLDSLPESANVRGVYFKNIRVVLKRAGLGAEFEALYPEQYSAIRWYSLSEHLEQLAVGGALLSGPQQVHAGMREIGRRNAKGFAESLIGKATMRVLSSDPIKLLKQGAVARTLTCDYGRWELSVLSSGCAVMEMVDEFAWMESYLVGAVEGTFEAIGKTVSVTVELESSSKGRHLLSWQP